MNPIFRDLLGMAPGLITGLRDPQAGSALMAGWERARKEHEARTRQQQQDTLAGEDRQWRIDRQTEQDRIAAEDRKRRQALELPQMGTSLANAGSVAETPEGAESAIDSLYRIMAPALGGVEQLGGLRDTAILQAQRTITGRQKKQVEAYVEQALKTSFVADNPDADPELQLPEHLSKLMGKPSAKLSELQQFAQLPVGKPQGKTRTPPAAGSFEDYVEKKYGPNPTAEQILEARKVYQQVDDRPRVTVNTGQQGAFPPNVQRRIDAVIKGFDSQPIVKRTQTMSEGVSFAQALKDDTTNPADDQALIYAFAKVMDPDSVVREGEYATVQKYAQSWAERFGFDVKRIFSNTSFLTPEARKNMKATLMTKFGVERKAYDNLRNEYGKRIDRITGKGGGMDELTDYGAAFPQGPGSNKPPRGANPFTQREQGQ